MSDRADNSVLNLAVGGIRALKAYEPGKPLAELEREYGITEAVKLASNENPLGMSALASQAIIESVQSASLYPDGNAYYLKQALSKHLSVDDVRIDIGQITVGNGSNELLEIIARSFVSQHEAVMYSQHAFAVYPLVTQAIGATHQMIAANHWGHDLDAMLDGITAQTKVIFIANPNNPTGTYLDSALLYAFIQKVRKDIIVVIDEAYHEYVSIDTYVSAMTWVAEFENLIVSRTFSKAYGLAGLRVGYCVSQNVVADVLNRVRQPFNVSVPAQAAAELALSDQGFIKRTVDLNAEGKSQLYSAFSDMGLNYIPSQGNFIAVDVQRNVNELNEALLKQGVIIRPIEAYQMPGYIRVSVGMESQNTQFLSALALVMSESECIV